jgi:hypothetical protein
MNDAGADARQLLEHLAAGHPDLLHGPRVQALRQIVVQNYHWDPAGRLRWRDDEGDAGLPPSAVRHRHLATGEATGNSARVVAWMSSPTRSGTAAIVTLFATAASDIRPPASPCPPGPDGHREQQRAPGGCPFHSALDVKPRTTT